MTAEQFAYWLQGYAEMNAAPPTEDQWNTIRAHLALVFNKVTPDYFDALHKQLESPTVTPSFELRPTVTCSLPGVAVTDTTTRLVC